jgi:V8-like Glu-specific endopeptidase
MGRVDAVINFLVDRRRAETRTSALVLLLVVLRDLTRPEDDLYARLSDLAKELEKVLQVSTSPDRPGSVEEANPENQQMIFTTDWLRLLENIQAVGKLNVPQIIRGQVTERFPSGTGWLVAPKIAMTCWHVIKARRSLDGRPHDTDLAVQVTNSVLTFDYTLPGKGVEYQIAAMECYDATLDYALLSLEDREDYPLSNRGFLNLDVGVPLTLQTALYIIQHPKGQPQQASSGRFVKYKQGQPDRIFHSAPTEKGTSGAPVLNVRNWGVVALHNSEDETFHLREATLLKAILPHIQQTRPDLYSQIMNAH